jgi:spore maturation protein CgeB
MKLLRVTTAYGIYLQKFYARKVVRIDLSYQEMLAPFEYDAFGWADFWKSALAPLGYEVMDVTANNEPVQKAWAREHGVAADRADWLLDLPLKQALEFRPDVLFMDDYSTFDASWLKEIRRLVPSIKLVLGWCGADYRDLSVFGQYDVVLSCVHGTVSHMRQMGHRAEHLDHAFDPRILARIDSERLPATPFTFIGQMGSLDGPHRERERLLMHLARTTDIKILSPLGDTPWTDRAKDRIKPALFMTTKALRAAGVGEQFLQSTPFLGRSTTWIRPPPPRVNSVFRGHLSPSVFGLRMFQTLHDSRTTLNCHISLPNVSASNMRLFEATGVGTCLLTDAKPRLEDLFSVDVEVVTYTCATDCTQKVKWLLDHPSERRRIAQAAQRRTLRDHTFDRRAPVLDSIIRAEL